MRTLADARRIGALMQALGHEARHEGRVYLTGGATAVLVGWRESTIDVDLRFVPEDDRLLRALPELKERLQLNIELACPSDFLPEVPGWETRSRFIAQHGKLAWLHYDFYAQALAKIERGHSQDVGDIEAMLRLGLIEAGEVRRFFHLIEPELYRYPALDPASFARAVDQAMSAG